MMGAATARHKRADTERVLSPSILNSLSNKLEKGSCLVSYQNFEN